MFTTFFTLQGYNTFMKKRPFGQFADIDNKSLGKSYWKN